MQKYNFSRIRSTPVPTSYQKPIVYYLSLRASLRPLFHSLQRPLFSAPARAPIRPRFAPSYILLI